MRLRLKFIDASNFKTMLFVMSVTMILTGMVLGFIVLEWANDNTIYWNTYIGLTVLLVASSVFFLTVLKSFNIYSKSVDK